MSRPARRPPGLAAAILELLDARDADSSVCPSEVARAVGGDGWRALMPDVREAAARLARGGKIEVTQRGRVVDVARARGPVRLRRPR